MTNPDLANQKARIPGSRALLDGPYFHRRRDGGLDLEAHIQLYGGRDRGLLSFTEGTITHSFTPEQVRGARRHYSMRELKGYLTQGLILLLQQLYPGTVPQQEVVEGLVVTSMPRRYNHR